MTVTSLLCIRKADLNVSNLPLFSFPLLLLLNLFFGKKTIFLKLKVVFIVSDSKFVITSLKPVEQVGNDNL